MKRKRNLLVVLLLLCTIGLGVGYAAITGTLTITPSAVIEDQDFAVAFVKFLSVQTVTNNSTGNAQSGVSIDGQAKGNPDLNVVCTANGQTIAVEGTIENRTAVSLQATGLQDQGDSVKATLTIHNYNNVPMYLTLNANNVYNNTHCNIVCDLQPGTVIAAGGDVNVAVTFTLTNVENLWTGNADTITENFTLVIDATSIAPGQGQN